MRVIHLLRKPLATATVAQNLVRHKTGALHIEACRVGKDTARGDRYAGKAPQGGGTGHTYVAPHSDPWDVPEGRWPSNLILEHRPDCEKRGYKRVRGTAPKGPGAPPAWESGGWKATSRVNAPTSPDGMETIEDWRCDPSCPCADMDRQTALLDLDGDVIVGGASRFYLHVGGHLCPASDE